MRRHGFDTNCSKSSIILPLIKVWCCGSGKDDLRQSGSLYTAAFHRLLYSTRLDAIVSIRGD